MTRSIPKEDVVRRIHSDGFVLDAHSDISLLDVYPRRLQGQRGVMKKIHLPLHKKGGVHGAIITLHNDWARWTTHYEGATKQTLELIEFMFQEERESGGGFVIAENGTQMEEAHGKGKFSVLMSLEGAKALEGSLEVLHALYRLGVRAMGLTHNVRNQYADGAAVKENFGLTESGRRLVEELDRLNMLLDLAHISERGFYDAIETTRHIPVISHSACRSLHEFDGGKIPLRNVTDKQIQTLADRGGVMGVACLRPFLADSNATIDHYVKHIEHMIKIVGVNHVGIGLDFVGYAPDINFALIGNTSINPYGKDAVAGLEDITKTPNLTRALLRKGYSEGEVRKILGGNFVRVLKRVLG